MRCVESGSDYSEVVIEDIVDGVENALPVEPAPDSRELREAWQKLGASGLWKNGEDG